MAPRTNDRIEKRLHQRTVQANICVPVVGAIAQLGERLHGMQEVAGSIPAGSTTFLLRPHRLEA